jgi:hypothetical protein
MKRAIVLVGVALAIPTGVAFAKPPATHPSHSHAAPKVMYVLKGKLSAYTAATATTDGSISIAVSHSNFHAHTLVGQTVTFSTTMSTKAPSAISDGAKGVLKFKAPLRMPAGTVMASVLPTMAKALHVVVQSHH